MRAFCRAFLNGDAEEIRRRLTVIMSRMISILDTKARDEQKDNFYHGLLRSDGREDITAYGIAYCKKRCMVVCEKI